MSDYACPEMLVTTDWVLEHHDDPKVRVVEVDVDTSAYEQGHVPGAVGLNWQTQLQDQVRRDLVSQDELEQLLGGHGISRDDTIILYGDHSNWFAAYALWILKYYGHDDVRLMNGGRQKWLAEAKPLQHDVTEYKPTAYRASSPNRALRAMINDVLGQTAHALVDVRSPDEFSGKVIAPPGMTETAQRGGHIPGASNVPWVTAVNEDGTFKSADELRRIYIDGAGVDPAEETIAYCRIGERSSHTWFVLRYLLGVEKVRNYDGSWTEYGSMVGVPIER